jgi:hypothetical protein
MHKLYPLSAQTVSVRCRNCIRLIHKMYPVDVQAVSAWCANCIRSVHKLYVLRAQTIRLTLKLRRFSVEFDPSVVEIKFSYSLETLYYGAFGPYTSSAVQHRTQTFGTCICVLPQVKSCADDFSVGSPGTI